MAGEDISGHPKERYDTLGGQKGGTIALTEEIHICPTCGSRLFPAFSLSLMFVNFTTLIKNRWCCDSGHIWDEPPEGFAWEKK